MSNPYSKKDLAQFLGVFTAGQKLNGGALGKPLTKRERERLGVQPVQGRETYGTPRYKAGGGHGILPRHPFSLAQRIQSCEVILGAPTGEDGRKIAGWLHRIVAARTLK